MRRVTTLETIGEAIGKLGSHLECQEGKERQRERERERKGEKEMKCERECVDFLRVKVRERFSSIKLRKIIRTPTKSRRLERMSEILVNICERETIHIIRSGRQIALRFMITIVREIEERYRMRLEKKKRRFRAEAT